MQRRLFPKKFNMSALDAFNQAKAGEPAAIAMWKEFGFHMGFAIKTVVYTYDPEVIILGRIPCKCIFIF